jgi:hypothetical protein
LDIGRRGDRQEKKRPTTILYVRGIAEVRKYLKKKISKSGILRWASLRYIPMWYCTKEEDEEIGEEEEAWIKMKI